MTRATFTRFWMKVDKRGPIQPHMSTRCWLWTASTFKGGYGKFWYNKRNHPAQRIAWLVKTGKMSKQFVLHRCDVPGCVRFSHLFEGTVIDNNQDCIAKGRRPSIKGDRNPSRRRPERLARNEQHSMCKFTDKQILAFRARHAAGESQASIARSEGISKSHLCNVIKNLYREIPQ